MKIIFYLFFWYYFFFPRRRRNWSMTPVQVREFEGYSGLRFPVDRVWSQEHTKPCKVKGCNRGAYHRSYCFFHALTEAPW